MGQRISPTTPILFITAPTRAVYFPPMSIVTAQLAALAIPDSAAPAETMQTAVSGSCAQIASSVAIPQSPSAAVAVALRLIQWLRVRTRSLSTTKPPVMTRSEEHTSELQSPYVISYAVFF